MHLERDLRKDEGRGKAIRNDALPLQLCINCKRRKEQSRMNFVTIPAHKFLHIKNYESNGYWDFWRKQNLIPGQDYETICGLLDSIKGKLDDAGGSEVNCASGQIMAYLNDPAGRLCDWGIHRAECWGVRLPSDYQGNVPPQMSMVDIPESEYIVFEHGPFNYEQENCSVEEKIEKAMAAFDYAGAGCCQTSFRPLLSRNKHKTKAGGNRAGACNRKRNYRPISNRISSQLRLIKVA